MWRIAMEVKHGISLTSDLLNIYIDCIFLFFIIFFKIKKNVTIFHYESQNTK
jgi:hypothetical protein